MNNERMILDKTKQLEQILRGRGYDGRGLHELTSAAESDISFKAIKSCRRVASIRNKVVHDPDFDLSDVALMTFIEAADTAVLELQPSAALNTTAVTLSASSLRTSLNERDTDTFFRSWKGERYDTDQPETQIPMTHTKSTLKEKAGFVAACMAIGGFLLWREIKD